MILAGVAFLPVLVCIFVEMYKSPGTGVWYRRLAEVDYLIISIMKRGRPSNTSVIWRGRCQISSKFRMDIAKTKVGD